MLNLNRLTCFTTILPTLVRLSDAFCFRSQYTVRRLIHSTSVSNNSCLDNDSTRQEKKETTVIANHTFRRPTDKDVKTIEHQLFHTVKKSQVFCTSSKLCKHGHAQAFGLHPTNGIKPVSGMFRLTCPLLVQAIDKWENEHAGVRVMSDWLRINDNRGANTTGLTKDQKKTGYDMANQAQKDIRMELAREDIERLKSSMGEYNAKRFLESGIAGIPADQTYNVKCIHAHVADYLCRSSSNNDANIIGKHALQTLQQKGLEILGNDICCQQCNGQHGEWKYVPKKNRQKLRSKRLRRQQMSSIDDKTQANLK